MSRLFRLIALFVVACPAAHSIGQEAPAKPEPALEGVIPTEPGFGVGWEQTVRSKRGDEPCDLFVLWVENNWLFVRRTDSQGDVDWQIKLAEASHFGAPRIAMKVNGFGFEVTSQQSHYYIRETLEFLRAVRERGDQGAVLQESLLGASAKSVSTGIAKLLTIGGWESGEWYYVTTGPNAKLTNCVVRLDPIKEHGYGVQTAFGELLHGFHGDQHFWDDGELLIAYRTLRGPYEAGEATRRIRENLPGKPAPEISASSWFNTEPLDLKQLTGKVVLLDFWATWCGPCVANLPKVEALAAKYADRGFKVIGVHSADGGDKCGDYLKEKHPGFATAVDDGSTSERYGIGGIPAYFIIDKTGAVAEVSTGGVPDEATIVKLLDAQDQ